ncbi:MAG: type I-C CRISPR-associated protein Cas5 [Planctomycetes bacterium]|nr:type I-C CRISPR-associated protein Cas5 [Planctomycetota bacterium]
MSGQRSPTLCVRVRGQLACFTRPELKVERVSYPVMTPSAARGVLEAILWKPAIQWHVERIHVLNPIQFTAFRRNEVNHKAPCPKAKLVEEGGPAPVYYADDESHRAQRNTVALRDVDYLIEAHLTITDRAGPDDNMTKFVDMFQRRVAKGQHFHQPYLGCREFVAEVSPPDRCTQPIQETRDLGLMLWDVDYTGAEKRPIFFQACLEDGVLAVPAETETTLAVPQVEGGAQ